MGIPIKRGIEPIPGGMVSVPLTLGALIATFAPGGHFSVLSRGPLYRRPAHSGGLLCLYGSQHPFRVPAPCRGKGGALAAKVLLGATASLIVGHLLGTEPVPTRLLAGLSTLAVVAAINNTNSGLLAFPWRTQPGAILPMPQPPRAATVGKKIFANS